MAKRRASGEGNIRKRKDGRWEGQYTAGHDLVSEKTIYKNVLGKTPPEVKEKRKAAISENTELDIVRAEQYRTGNWPPARGTAGPEMGRITESTPPRSPPYVSTLALQNGVDTKTVSGALR